MRISILVVNYNGGALLRECVAELCFHQPSDSELIVVDNASTDGSIDVIMREFDSVRVIHSQVNHGFGAGNNLAAKSASGRYLLFINPDTKVRAGWAEALVSTLERDASIGLATPKIVLMDAEGQINTCGNIVHISGLTMCRAFGKSVATMNDVEQLAAVSGAAFAMRRAEFVRLGGFDEAFHMYMEDTELSLRARVAGLSCVYVPDSVIAHRYTLRIGPDKVFLQERNRYMMLLKILRWRTLVGLLPSLLLAEVVTWGFVLMRDRKRIGNKLRAYMWVATHWTQLMTQRRTTQVLRKISDRELLAPCSTRLEFAQIGAGAVAHWADRLLTPIFRLFKHAALALAQ